MRKEMIILIGCIVGYFIIMILAKNIYSGMIAKAMMKNDEKKARKLLFSNLAIFLLNHQMLCLMRASFCCGDEKYEEAMRYCNMIKTDKLSVDKKMSYYTLKLEIALGMKNLTMAEQVQKELKELNQVEKSDDIQEMIEDNDIQIALLLNYDKRVIEQLNKKIKACQSQEEKGYLMINLAKAYYKNQQNDEAVNALKQAKKWISNELTLQVIERSLADLTLLD